MSNKIWKVVFAASIVLIVVASVNIFILSREYQKGINEYKALEGYVKVVEVPEEKPVQKEETAEEVEEVKESVIPISVEVDFAALGAINEDLVGWIYYSPLDINYPVVRGDDNEYYTHYTFENEKNASGAIFMDSLNKPDMSNYNTIIYGHNMRNGTMFGSLKKLLSDESIITENPYFYIFTEDKAYMYEIASVYITNQTSDTYNLIGSEEEQQEYIDYIKSSSTWYWGKELWSSDKIVTLSTCHGLHSNNRTIVHGVLIAEEDR
ncbi:MAG: class B sortase [Lachnospiraceae bacterium]|nr:class B sortase [Lachnospiraceae bacterium]